MTTEDFINDWGKDYLKHTRTGLFKAIIEVIRDASPINESADRTAGDVVVAGHVLFAEAKSYQRVINLLTTGLLQKPKQDSPEADYKEKPEI